MCIAWGVGGTGYPMPCAPGPNGEPVRTISEFTKYKFEWKFKWFWNKLFGYAGYFSIKVSERFLWAECTSWCCENLGNEDVKLEFLGGQVVGNQFGRIYFKKESDALLFKMSIS